MTSMRSETTLRAAEAIRLLMGMAHVTEQQIIEATRITAINGKKRGKAPITLQDIDKLAAFFELDPLVFLLERAAVLRYLADGGGTVDLRVPKPSCIAALWAPWPKLFDDDSYFINTDQPQEPVETESLAPLRKAS